MSKKLKLGVIGVGSMGKNHARIYSELSGVELIGVADIDEKKAQETAQKFRCQSFGSYRKLLEKVDAVSIASPTLLHYEIALECISAGVHMLIEKPFTRTAEEGKDLIEKSKASHTLIQAGFVDRYNPAVQKLSKLTAGEEIIALEIRRLSPPIQRASDVSVVFDLMIHDIDHALEFAGSKVKSVCAAGIYAYAVASLQFENGILANLTASKASYTKIREFNLSTKNSYLSADMFTNKVKIARVKEGAVGKQYFNFADLNTWIEECPPAEPLKEELLDFIKCCQEQSKPAAGAESALEVIKIAGEIEKLCGLP